MKKHNYIFVVLLLSALLSSCVKAKIYCISNQGNDENDGSRDKPWKSLNASNLSLLQAGDTVFFMGGECFETKIMIDSLTAGTKGKPVVITSDKQNPAVIHSGNDYGLWIEKSKNLKIENLKFRGNGRKEGNTQPGVFISACQDMIISNLDIEGFQKSGLQIHASSEIIADNVNAHNNGFAGIFVSGEYGRKDASHHIIIKDCKAENNPGDPTVLDNHSGNGILVGHSTNVTIEYCVATNNGWDMPRKGNGPVGIWTYESNSILIQYCIAYKNKTSEGADDGGGFDLDGGVTNSIIQYCLSYENEGSGFGLFQYAGASPWYNNTIRHCISENDGSVSAAQAAIYVWNSSDDPEQLKDCYIYNNTIYNEKGAAINYAAQSKHLGFKFHNNIFVTKDKLITGKELITDPHQLKSLRWGVKKITLFKKTSVLNLLHQLPAIYQ